jgi:hypothetical protein
MAEIVGATKSPTGGISSRSSVGCPPQALIASKITRAIRSSMFLHTFIILVLSSANSQILKRTFTFIIY